MAVTIRVKRGTATQWAARTTPLLSGEIGYDLTNKITKIGDGATLWATLPSIDSSGASNTGDVTFDGVQVIGAGTASGDGYGLGTLPHQTIFIFVQVEHRMLLMQTYFLVEKETTFIFLTVEET
jgi:hypothetical protein